MKRCFLALLCVMALSGCMEQEVDMTTSLYDPFVVAGEHDGIEMGNTASLPTTFSLPYAAEYTLDPLTCSTGMQQTLGSLLYEGLFYLDTYFAPQPLVCLDYHYDSETYTYTLTLRPNVFFSDGSALTAQDVCDTLVRAKSSQRYGSRLSDVVAIKALDNAVTITLGVDNAKFVALLDIPIVKSGTQDDLIPLGTGPYRVDSQEENSALRPNYFWWQKQALPLEEIPLIDCANQDLMQYRFTTHDVQLIVTDLIGVNPLQASGNITYEKAETTILHYLGMNMNTSLLQSATVRKALSLGLNRDALVSAFLSGHGVATQFPVSPRSPLYPDDLDITYQSSDFQAALEQAGLSKGNPQTLRLIVNAENSFKVATANQIAHNLTQGNLTVRVLPLSWADYQLALETGDYDLYYGEVQLTADWNLTELLSIGGSLNFGGYASSAMDAAIAQYLSGSHIADDMDALSALFQQEMPLLTLCFESTAVLSQSGVLESASHTQANPFYQFHTWTIHLESD